MSMERLVHECRMLMKERDLLTKRLTEATAAFQHQVEADRREGVSLSHTHTYTPALLFNPS